MIFPRMFWGQNGGIPVVQDNGSTTNASDWPDLSRSKAALEEYDRTRPERDAMLRDARTNEDVAAWMKAEGAATAKVREAFKTVVRAHLRHGTTSIVPTTTVAPHQRLLAVLELCRQWRRERAPGEARVLGAHLYGPYFNYDARGCHPGGDVRPPEASEFEQYLEYADSLVTATVAPELPSAEAPRRLEPLHNWCSSTASSPRSRTSSSRAGA